MTVFVLRRALTCLCVVASGATAAAQTPFSPIDLANQSIPLGEAAVADGSQGKLAGLFAALPCRVQVTNSAIVPVGQASCPTLWAMVDPRELELDFGDAGSVHLKPAAIRQQGGASLASDGASVTWGASGPPAAKLAALAFEHAGSDVRPVRWHWVDAIGGLKLDGANAKAARQLAGRYRLYAAGPDGSVHVWPVLPKGNFGPPARRVTPTVETPPTVMAAAATDPAVADADDPALACPPAVLPHADMIVVCVDATGGAISYDMRPENTRLTKPNRYFFVHVLHTDDRKVGISLGGDVGSWVPGTRGNLRLEPQGGFNLGGGDAEPKVIATTRVFAPRRPGLAPLNITLKTLAGEAVGDPLEVEFWIEKTYSGAFRMGIAGVFFGGVEQTYQKVTQPNSQQAEIAVDDTNLMDLDLVIGYSPYLDSGGRPATGCENAPFCFNPYFGIGLLSTNGNGDLDWLKSVHIGAEWELTEAFAIGLTATLRRVERLSQGLGVGSPIQGDIPTDNRFVFGMGVVINLSPSFFRIGAKGAAGLLR